jgi:hypothetical protein
MGTAGADLARGMMMSDLQVKAERMALALWSDIKTEWRINENGVCFALDSRLQAMYDVLLRQSAHVDPRQAHTADPRETKPL